MDKTPILTSMKSRIRLFVVVLVMLGLPLQGALAAIMPLCTQGPQSAHQALNPFPGFEAQNHSSSPASPCSQHDMDNADESAPEGIEGPDEMALTCDGAVCHMSGSGLPAFTTQVNSAGGFSYPVVPNVRFTSLILKQLQRPPLS